SRATRHALVTRAELVGASPRGTARPPSGDRDRRTPRGRARSAPPCRPRGGLRARSPDAAGLGKSLPRSERGPRRAERSRRSLTSLTKGPPPRYSGKPLDNSLFNHAFTNVHSSATNLG